MAGTDPSWLSPALAIGTAFGAMVAALWAGRKAPSRPEGELTVTGGALADTRTLKLLNDNVVEAGADLRRELRHGREALEELRDAVREQTDATVNLVRFVKRGSSDV